MVDVGAKPVTVRQAKAQGRMRLSSSAAQLIKSGQGPKGSVFAVATVAAINAAKRTSDLVPLCHLLPLDQVTVDFEIDDSAGIVICTATAGATARTGVEMEALVAVHIGLLTVYDMCKAVDRDMEVISVKLIAKTGGTKKLS